MKVHELTVTTKADRKRVGRGIGSGTGKTAGRGTKGQNSRSGGGVRIGFEGGQNPLAKRLPKKRGFRSLNRVDQVTLRVSRLEEFKAGAVITNTELVAQGIIGQPHAKVRVVAGGELTKKLTVQLFGATAAAREMITKAGGTYTVTELPKRPKRPSARNRQS
jgi:large subunit ribosomal protein L15